jgi:outer membrane lipoprotein-sorting protein
LRIVTVQRARCVFALPIAIVACAALHAAAPPDLFDELYQRGRKQNSHLKSFTASFTETTSSPLLTRDLTARGTVAVERPGRIALRYTEPDERLVLIDGDRMTVSWPSRKIRQVKDIGASQRRVQQYFVEGSADDLRSHFTIAAREADDRAGTYLVTMVPKRTQIREGLSKLELWVDRDSLLMTAMRMTFPAGDIKLMTFTDIKPDAVIDPGMFRESSANKTP